LKLNQLYYIENNFKPYIIAEFLVILHLHFYKHWMECVRKVKDRAVLPLKQCVSVCLYRELESTVEELRGNVINRKTRVNMSDVENMALILNKSRSL
jgi:hypothetical protein